jgi:hypothetical protein
MLRVDGWLSILLRYLFLYLFESYLINFKGCGRIGRGLILRHCYPGNFLEELRDITKNLTARPVYNLE